MVVARNPKAWEMERPMGIRNVGTYTQPIYTPDQQVRLHVDAEGNPQGRSNTAPYDPCGAPGGAGGGVCENPCSTTSEVNLNYVGNGRGAFVAETTYCYVGQGAGEYDYPVLQRGCGWCKGCNWCLTCALLLALASLLTLLFVWSPWKSGIKHIEDAAKDVAEDVAKTSHHLSQYKCSGSTTDWGLEHKAHCCSVENIGCPTHESSAPSEPAKPAPKNICNFGGVDSWSADKRVFCCAMYHNGCNTPQPVPAAPPVHSAPAPAPDSAYEEGAVPFDCDAGFANWVQGWSIAKKAWCCKSTGRGCANASGCSPTAATQTTSTQARDEAGATTTTMQTPTTSSSATSDDDGATHTTMGSGPDSDSEEKFNCNKDYGRWEKVWSAKKQAHCCTAEDKGCPPASS